MPRFLTVPGLLSTTNGTRNNADFCKTEVASQNTSSNLLNQVSSKKARKTEEQLSP